MKKQIDLSNITKVEQVLEDSKLFNKRISRYTKRYKTPTTNERWAFLKKAGVQLMRGEFTWDIMKNPKDVYKKKTTFTRVHSFQGFDEIDQDSRELAACAWVVLNKGEVCY